MFTGIVQATAPLVERLDTPGLSRVTVELPEDLCSGISVGASVAVDGVCLTVVAFQKPRVSFDVMLETLRLTTLGAVVPGALVNVERAARLGDEIGGHLVSGHIDLQARVVRIDTPDNNRIITFGVDEPFRKYFFRKGFVCINGISLTIANAERNQGEFSVYLIPETLRRTNAAAWNVGGRVNIEIDRQTQATVDTVYAIVAKDSSPDLKD